MKKMSSWTSPCSLVIMACLVAYMQHTDEQYFFQPFFSDLDPQHWM